MSRTHEWAGEYRRPDRLRRRCARAQFHARGSKARSLAIGAESHDPRPGGPVGHTFADPHDTQRLAESAGERLLQTVGPRLEEIEAELAAVRELRDKPAGTIRITATENATDTILLPKLA